ncbi:hypothetical protein MMC19_004113 [Ptychographa xylographoides]|nr:hypothetical protein [Ptychographa xylographoides]
MVDPDLQDIHDFLVEVAMRAGDMITSARPSTSKIDTKKNSSDLVTETDQAVEVMVSSALKSRYPSYEFLGEESYKPGMHLTSAPTFVCDPIDGTTNFVHAYPYVSISLAFVHNLVPKVGVVFNPFTSQIYHAIKGKGSYLTSTTLSSDDPAKMQQLPLRNPPEPLKGLDQALIAIEWGNERSGNNYAVKVNTFRVLAASKEDGGAMVHSLRSLGSAALNLCAVATGGLDAYWEGGCWAWDVAAGWVILEEAGGMMVGGNKGEWEPSVDQRRYLAVRGTERGTEEQKTFIEAFWGCIQGTLEYDI